MRNIIFFLLFFILIIQVYAGGSAQAAERETRIQNNEWILCITNPDISSLPPDRAGIVDIITRKLVDRLKDVSYRTRISPEYAYYEEQAWFNDRTAAARALTAKLEERSSLIYRGDPIWRYRQNLARIDAEIEKLRASLEETENNAPVINRDPVFRLTNANLDFSFPAAPGAGLESRFCRDQRIDAFLVSSVTEFYGRYLLSVKLYTAYTGTYTWEDSIIFSPENTDSALDDIARRLISVLSGNQPASVTINAQPQEALVLINRSFIGRGDIGTLQYPPGTIIIDVSAPHHESITLKTDLSGGELVDININLNPIEYVNVDISAETQGSIYRGSLYIGEAPLTLRLPLNSLEYIEFETEDLNKTSIVFQTPDTPGFMQALSFNAAIPLQSGLIDMERQHFYWAWGGTWIAGITAWLAYYSFVSADFTVRHNYNTTGMLNEAFFNSYQNKYNFYIGTIIVAGAAAGYGIYRLVRYISAANNEAIPIIKTGRN